MTDMIDRLTTENTRMREEMRTLRDEHTEVLHQMFNFEKKNQDLVRDNEHLRTLQNDINQNISEVLVTRSKNLLTQEAVRPPEADISIR